jgi:ankyrin repeat protein
MIKSASIVEHDDIILKPNVGHLWLSAVDGGDFFKLEDLMEDGINLNLKMTDGTTLFLYFIDNILKLDKSIDDEINYSTDVKNIVEKMLKDENLDVNICDYYGDSALNSAILNWDTEIIKMLLQHPNIDVNIKNSEGDTPLMLASTLDNKEVVELLLKHPNIDVKITNVLGQDYLTIGKC